MPANVFTWLWIAFGVLTLGAILYGVFRNVPGLYWKVVICLVPVLASAIIVARATARYDAGEGGFRLGVDLVGGTILVYEIDKDKLQANQKYDSKEMAAALKRRIDPNDLYNVTIRPIGETRVEIILPTGGAHQANLAEASWNDVLKKVNDQFSTELEGIKVKVDRGQPGALKKKLRDEIEAKNWTKLLAALNDKYPKLKDVKDLKLDEIKGQVQELIKRVVPASGATEAEVKAFVDASYKPVDAQKIDEFVNSVYAPMQQRKDVTGEEVQKIKDSIARVGSLEFRILANDVDDKDVFDALKALYKDATTKPDLLADIKRAAQNGDPPPLPKNPTGDWALAPHDNREQTRATYAWVELGRKERKDLGVDNASQTSETASRRWQEAAVARGKFDVLPLPDYGQTLLFSRPCENIKLTPEERAERQYEYFLLTRLPEKDPEGKDLGGLAVTGQDLINSAGMPDQNGKLEIHFAFNNRGANRFHRLTSANTPGSKENPFYRHLAVLLDGYIETSPTVNSPIRESGRIMSPQGFSQEEVDRTVRVLRSGALPATLKPRPVSENTIGATLGPDTIRKGLSAIQWAFVAILAFMCVYYRFSGFVASVALLANLLLTIAFMVFVNATFTLPGLAGLVLTLGMAVDANVLIYERLREERDRGANLILALRNGYDRALPTIIDTHLTSIFTAIVLYVVGNDQLKGFGVSLTAGLVISLFTSLFMTRTIFDLWMRFGLLKKLGMFRFFSKPNFDFMRVRYYWFTATIVLTILGLAIFLWRGPNGLNIDFVGGTAYGGVLKADAATDMEGLRKIFDTERQKGMLKVASVAQVGDDDLTYSVTYDEPRETVTVVLANRPAGTTKAEREDDVRNRAGQLPDWSVEQIFLSKATEVNTAGKSRYFTVRSTEREPDLVQITVDRLLRGSDGSRLQQSTELNVAKIIDTRAELKFSTPSSPGYLKTLLEREVAAMGVKDVALNLVGTDPNAEEGRHAQMTVEFGSDLLKSLAETALRPVFDAAKARLTASQVEVKGTTAKLEFTTPQPLDVVKAALEAELKAKGLDKATVTVKGEGEAKAGKYATASVELASATATALDESIVGKILAKTKEEFAKRPQPERLENFDGQLAADTQRMAMYAILASWIAILLFLWFRFGSWTFGAAAVLCLVHDLCFTLGMIALSHYLVSSSVLAPFFHGILRMEDFKIDLPAVAALLTLVGYSVSDTIVVFDRIREVRGKNPLLTAEMINDSVNQTLSRTILASMSVFLVVVVLYFLGGEGVHLFAFVMVVGVIVGTYSSIYIASPLLLIFGEGTPPKGTGVAPRPIPEGATV